MRLAFGVTRHTPYKRVHHILDTSSMPSSNKYDLPIFTHVHQMDLQDAIDSHNPVAFLYAKGWTWDMIMGALGI